MSFHRELSKALMLNTRHSARASALFALILSWALVASFSAAQEPSSPAPSKGLQLVFLGTNGGPPLNLDRSEPSTLLIVDGRPYLVDCGIGTIRRMLRANIQSETIGTIFFTHLHSDHDLGLADVMANDFLFAAPASVFNIYGPPQTQAFVQAAFDYIRIPNSVFAAERPGNPPLVSPFKAHEIQGPGLIYQDDKIRVIAAENAHYVVMPPAFRAKMKSYSYRFETPEGVVVFTGDTGPSDTVTELAKGADVLVSETSGATPAIISAFIRRMAERNHWSPERAKIFMAHMTQEHLNLQQVGEMASRARVKSVILYHSGSGNVTTYPPEVKKYYPGPVFAPADLDRYCLVPPSGARPASPALHPCR